jgi:hypothetical protein
MNDVESLTYHPSLESSMGSCGITVTLLHITPYNFQLQDVY